MLLKKCYMKKQSSVLKWKPRFFLVNYLVDNLFEYFDESNSKFKRVVFQLLKCLKVFKKGFTKL
jgi:hypothetical protein